MDGYEVKKVMDQIHISEKMKEDIIMNLQNKSESGKKRAWNVRRMAATAAAFAAAACIIGFPVRAAVSSLVKERMESVPKAQMTELNNMVQSQRVEADGFSREFTEKERARFKELHKAYESGNFPEGVIEQVDNAESAPDGTLCYIRATSFFNLPAQEMTDEEILQIIDFQHKMAYAVANGPQARAAAAAEAAKAETEENE